MCPNFEPSWGCIVYHLSRYLALRWSPGSLIHPLSPAIVVKDGVVDECCVLMENKALLVQKVGSEDVLWLIDHSDKRNFGFDSRVIPSGAWRARSATCCGSWKCTRFPQKPPALPAWRAICLAKTLVLSCRCRPRPVSLSSC